jgi:hypothetical protein
VYVTAAQYLAEVMCARLAARDKTSLPVRFWERPRWKKIFLQQVRLASGLLAAYPREAVSAALRSPEGRRAYSLGAPWIEELVRQQAERLATMAPPVTPPSPEPPPTALPDTPRPAFVQRPSLRKKLEE